MADSYYKALEQKTQKNFFSRADVSTIDRDTSKRQAVLQLLRQHCSGLLDCCSAIDLLSIKFIELLLLVSDCCLASILSQLLNSCFIEELCL